MENNAATTATDKIAEEAVRARQNRKQLRKNQVRHSATYQRLRIIKTDMGRDVFTGKHVYEYRTSVDTARPTKHRPWDVRARNRKANKVARASRRVNRAA